MSIEASIQEEWVCVSCGAEVVTDESSCPRCGSASDPLQGRVLAGKYQLVRRLAGGGMGDVYLAEHTRLRFKKERAIKILKAELLHDNTLRKRFLREVELTHLVSQDNPHIVHIHDDYGFEDGIGFYVMEFLEGDTLEDRIYRAPKGLSMRWVKTIATQLCSAMQSIHEAGIVHRDLKPANIFLIKDKEGEDFVKVMDFGIARSDHGGTQHTKEGSIVGTVQYLSPEQIRKLPGTELDGRSDIYAMGCILFEMLAGRAPFSMEAGTAQLDGVVGMSMAFQNIVMSHLMKPPPSLLGLRKDLAPGLVKLIEEMLAKDPEHRPANMAVVAARLESLALPKENLTVGWDMPGEEDIPSGQLANTDTIGSQESPSELLRQSASRSSHTPTPQKTALTASGAPPHVAFALGGEEFDKEDTHPPEKGYKRTLWLVILAGILLIGSSVGTYLYIVSQPETGGETSPTKMSAVGTSPTHQEPTPAAPRERPAPLGADRPAKANPHPPDTATPPEPVQMVAAHPTIRVRSRNRARVRSRKRARVRSRKRARRKVRERGWKKVTLQVPSGYLARFQLRISPRKAAQQQGLTLLRKPQPLTITVRSKVNSFGYYSCSFVLPVSARQLELAPLTSKSGLAPDSKRYCLVRWK